VVDGWAWVSVLIFIQDTGWITCCCCSFCFYLCVMVVTSNGGGTCGFTFIGNVLPFWWYIYALYVDRNAPSIALLLEGFTSRFKLSGLLNL